MKSIPCILSILRRPLQQAFIELAIVDATIDGNLHFIAKRSPRMRVRRLYIILRPLFLGRSRDASCSF